MFYLLLHFVKLKASLDPKLALACIICNLICAIRTLFIAVLLNLDSLEKTMYIKQHKIVLGPFFTRVSFLVFSF